MLVIHPKDKTTAMLSALYDGLEAQVVTDCRSTSILLIEIPKRMLAIDDVHSPLTTFNDKNFYYI